MESLILFEIRLPRALLALFVGATLGLGGAALQGLLRNPLAEPGIIGVSNCAALGAVVVFYYGLSQAAWFALPLGGLVGLATTTGAEGISASRIMLRSAACWVTEMARISSARPMARASSTVSVVI